MTKLEIAGLVVVGLVMVAGMVWQSSRTDAMLAEVEGLEVVCDINNVCGFRD